MSKTLSTTNKDVIIDSKEAKEMSAPKIIIVGGGIAGLVLALSLHKRLGITATVYEQAQAFTDGVGGAIGMYPNGLRVLRDISPHLLQTVRTMGYPYIYRRWYRHDGTEVAVGREGTLTPSGKTEGDELEPIGIRRWKLQRALCDACEEVGIEIHFGMRVERIDELVGKDDKNGLTGGGRFELIFATGKSKSTKSTKSIPVRADIVFGADGIKSKVREYVLNSNGKNITEQQPEYTGVTCLMGSSTTARPNRGICFPSSITSKCHMCTYPTGPNETIFQIYFPTPIENPESWGALSPERERLECDDLAKRLEGDGWDEQFVKPLRQCIPGSIVRVGLRSRDPLQSWVVVVNKTPSSSSSSSSPSSSSPSVVALLGDAAHPPVPYIGQGAMMAIEDAGTIAYLLEKVCLRTQDEDNTTSPTTQTQTQKQQLWNFTTSNIQKAMTIYEEIRIPRTRNVLGKSKTLGKTQQDRANNPMYNLFREWYIKFQVFLYGTLPIMKPGAMYDYTKDVDAVLQHYSK